MTAATQRKPLTWAGYAAAVWAIAYAVGVRGYQGLGGTLGLAGTFEDPGGMRRASLVAGAVIFLAGIGALAFVRPWGLRIPRMLVIGPALAGATYAMAHALTAYITKPLHLGAASGASALEHPRSRSSPCRRRISASACAAGNEPRGPLPLRELPAPLRVAVGVPELRRPLHDRADVGHGERDLPQLRRVDAAAHLSRRSHRPVGQAVGGDEMG